MNTQPTISGILVPIIILPLHNAPHPTPPFNDTPQFTFNTVTCHGLGNFVPAHTHPLKIIHEFS